MSDNRLEARVGEALRAKGWTVSAAESCTGGLIMHRLTNIPGSSAYVQGGVVAYSYESKETLLKVRPETLLTYGAVSAETAVEMVRGVMALFGTDVGVSITGIAGPGGGMPGKPVGQRTSPWRPRVACCASSITFGQVTARRSSTLAPTARWR